MAIGYKDRMEYIIKNDCVQTVDTTYYSVPRQQLLRGQNLIPAGLFWVKRLPN